MRWLTQKCLCRERNLTREEVRWFFFGIAGCNCGCYACYYWLTCLFLRSNYTLTWIFMRLESIFTDNKTLNSHNSRLLCYQILNSTSVFRALRGMYWRDKHPHQVTAAVQAPLHNAARPRIAQYLHKQPREGHVLYCLHIQSCVRMSHCCRLNIALLLGFRARRADVTERRAVPVCSSTAENYRATPTTLANMDTQRGQTNNVPFVCLDDTGFKICLVLTIHNSQTEPPWLSPKSSAKLFNRCFHISLATTKKMLDSIFSRNDSQEL